MRMAIFRALLLTTAAFGAFPASAQDSPPAPSQIESSGYVRLEVTLRTTSAEKAITFNSACPKQSLWGIDLKNLLAGARNVTMGVSISGPNLALIDVTPVSIDKKSSGFLGTSKSCDVTIDQMRYLSPAYYVRSYDGQQFNVAPVFKESKGVNPGLTPTVDTALGFALKLASVPVETAAPYQATLQTLLSQVSVSSKEAFPVHPVIKAGPVPADVEWKTSGLFTAKDNVAPLDVILVARLIPVATLIPAPASQANGKVVWSVSNVLSSPFAANISPGVNPGGTFRSFVESGLTDFRNAKTPAEATIACKAILDRVRGMGLSDRDQALLMWASTHEQPPAIGSYNLDHLACLDDAWTYAPAEITATRDMNANPPPPARVPATVKQMQATTQIDDAFALFFKTSIWADRKRFGTALFNYPATYRDVGGLLFDSSQTIQNADQWLAYHIASTPVADRIGCYTYVPAPDKDGKSMMYAVADIVAGRGVPQGLLIVTFGGVSGSEDAKIDAIEVSATASADQKAVILAANGTQCSSGYRPALVFGAN